MNTQLKVLLLFNAVMFIIAGLLEWRYYTASEQMDNSARRSAFSRSDLNSLYARSQSPPLDLGELHKSFRKAFPEPVNVSLSTGLVPHRATGQTALKRIAGDGSGKELSNAAVVLFCYNRTKYLEKTLSSLAELSGLDKVTVYISQDGQDMAVKDVIHKFEEGPLAPPKTRRFEHWQRERLPQLGHDQPGHAWLSQHYKWALDQAFLQKGHSHVIIVEDDMLFSPDFLHFFAATAVLLEQDPSLWCISTWNDNGLKTFDWDPMRMMRTSYFPGLGWMMRHELWLEIGPHWPKQSWDHWMRLNTTAKGRECVYPEVNRNYNIGEKGVNMNSQVFKQYLTQMSFNQELIMDYGDLSYLLEAEYEQQLVALSQDAELMSLPIGTRSLSQGKVYLALYTAESYPRTARKLGIWPFPRGHHHFVTKLPVKGAMLLLADQRFCPLLPEQHSMKPRKGLRAFPAAQHESCYAACRNQEMECNSHEFWFINSCEELSKHFPCEQGCAVELGNDVPNYVVDVSLGSFQTCLVNQKQPKCEAANPSTRRLCPCVPKQ
ncbi:TPA: hypothetical protein ACH3X2_009866 [Trebouxia sp. C0005]